MSVSGQGAAIMLSERTTPDYGARWPTSRRYYLCIDLHTTPPAPPHERPVYGTFLLKARLRSCLVNISRYAIRDIQSVAMTTMAITSGGRVGVFEDQANSSTSRKALMDLYSDRLHGPIPTKCTNNTFIRLAEPYCFERKDGMSTAPNLEELWMRVNVPVSFHGRFCHES